MLGAVAPGSLELTYHLPGGVVLYSFVDQSWAGDVGKQLLQLRSPFSRALAGLKR